ncbi:MAG: GlsB/YeaQ/YmgE family stress response membrane protein [Blastocatellales bacterium]
MAGQHVQRVPATHLPDGNFASDKGQLMFHLIAQISFGLAAGVIARLITPGRIPGGIVVTASIGLAGSLIGALAGRALFGTVSGPADWIVSILSTLFLLSVYRVVSGSRTAY